MILSRKTPLPVLDCCRILKISRSSLYRVPRPRTLDTSMDSALEKLAGKHARLGYRQLADKAGISPKAARLRLTRLGLMRRRKSKKIRTTVPVPMDAENLCRTPSGPGQLLVSDFTFIALPVGFAYLAVTLDVFSRRIRGFALSKSMKTDFVSQALTMAAHSGNLEPEWVHHSDRGSQYASQEFRELVASLSGKSSFSRPASPQDNAYAESFFSRFKDEEVRANDYQRFDEVVLAATHYIKEYNSYRKHSSLGKTSPIRFEEIYAELSSNIKSVS